MIDIESETLLSLSEAASVLPKVNGRRPHVSTLWRWVRRGCRGVFLEHLRFGHRVVTSREALSRFAQRLADVDRQTTAPSCLSPADERAQRELAEGGF